MVGLERAQPLRPAGTGDRAEFSAASGRVVYTRAKAGACGTNRRGTAIVNIMSEDEVLRIRLAELRRQHRALDAEIAALAENPLADQLQLRRLKKRKLALKDEIARLEDRLYPDIIA